MPLLQEDRQFWSEPSLVKAAEAYVQSHLKEANVDSSHDWWHIDRVRNLATSILHDEYPSASDGYLSTVQLCAVLHDVADWKYSGCDKAGASTVRAFLEGQNADERLIGAVLFVVQNIGFKDSLKHATRPSSGNPDIDMMLDIVQDADRLDAIGAVGIARCFTFGGRFNRTLHQPGEQPRVGLTKEEYMSSSHQQTTINHFYEKLLTLEKRMNTRKGKAMGAERTSFMQGYLDRFFTEWEGSR